MNKRQVYFLQVWLPVLLWMLFIFILSSVPGPKIPDLPVPYYHKVVHFFEYAILGALCIRALAQGRSGIKSLKASVLAWTISSGFAFSDEWHQTFVFGRSGKLEDVYFDVICAVIGIVFYLKGWRLFRREKPAVSLEPGSVTSSGE